MTRLEAPAFDEVEFDRGYDAAILNDKFMEEHYEELQTEHGGEVVAIADGELKSSGATVDEVIKDLKTQGIDLAKVLVEFVPILGAIISF